MSRNNAYTIPSNSKPSTTARARLWPVSRGRRFVALPEFPWWAKGIVRSGVTEELVAMPVEREPLKEL
jgi:hypothetical protein